jgi:hypothetical protein
MSEDTPDDAKKPAHPLTNRLTHPNALRKDSDFVARPGFRNPPTARSRARTRKEKK